MIPLIGYINVILNTQCGVCSVNFHWLNLANLATLQDFHLPVLQIRFFFFAANKRPSLYIKPFMECPKFPLRRWRKSSQGRSSREQRFSRGAGVSWVSDKQDMHVIPMRSSNNTALEKEQGTLPWYSIAVTTWWSFEAENPQALWSERWKQIG